MTLLYKLLALAAAVALPAALITTNVRLAFGSLPIYTYAIDAFDAPGRMGIPREELVKAARGIIDYFNSDEELPTFTIRVSGVEEPFFNEREALHFRDVRDLLRQVYTLQVASLAVVFAALGAGLVAAYRKNTAPLAGLLRALRRSAYATVGGLIAIGAVAALGGFSFLFLQFHLLSFSNDLWQATATDRMTQLFPEQFFLQGTLLIGVITIVQASLVALGTTLALRALSEKTGPAPDRGPALTKARGKG